MIIKILQNTGLPSEITIEDESVRNYTLKFAESLCEYFANIGAKLSKKLPCSNAFSFKIHSKLHIHSFILHEITPEEESKGLILEMQLLSSSGVIS